MKNVNFEPEKSWVPKVNWSHGDKPYLTYPSSESQVLAVRKEMRRCGRTIPDARCSDQKVARNCPQAEWKNCREDGVHNAAWGHAAGATPGVRAAGVGTLTGHLCSNSTHPQSKV